VATSKNVLIVIEASDEITLKSVRNLKNVHVLTVDQLNAYDVVVSDDIVFTKAAYDWFVNKKQGADKKQEAGE
jgi:large subunit ribosomal protein L4